MTTASEQIVFERKEQGFTLMEILVSMAIIAIVIVSLFRMQSGTLDLAAVNRFHNTAPFLAKKQLILLESDLDGKETDQGEFDPPFDGYQWRYRVSETTLDADEDLPETDVGVLKKIELEITRKSTSRSYRIRTFRWHNEE